MNVISKYCLCSTSLGSGQHWWLLYRASDSLVECFDSLGTSESYVRAHIPFGHYCVFNNTALQTEDSISCGLFTVFFIIERIFNEDLHYEELINEIFSTDKLGNEHVVKQFINCL